MELDKKLTMEDILAADNVAELFGDDDLLKIGAECFELFSIDYRSMDEWLKNHATALKLAKMTREEKSTPWPGAANMKWPLLITAALQFSARASSVMVRDGEMVKFSSTGMDRDGTIRERCARLEKAMNVYVCEKMESFLPSLDRLLMSLPVCDMAYKKIAWDAVAGMPTSDLVLPDEFIVNAASKPDVDPHRGTHIIPLYANDVISRMRSGQWITDDEITEAMKDGGEESKTDDSKGRGVEEVFHEQHGWFDFDGDGYEEPYIITYHKQTMRVVRIGKRFEEGDIDYNDEKEIVSIKPYNAFTAYGMLPSIDGSYHWMGYGTLATSTSEAINAAFNSLYDAASLANANSGFLAKGFKNKGDTPLLPGEFRQSDMAPEDLDKAIKMMPSKEPSMAMLQLLQFLISSGKEMLATGDVMTGQAVNAGTPATAILTAVEEGGRVYSAIIKRVYRSMQQEYCKIAELIGRYGDKDDYLDLVGVPPIPEVPDMPQPNRAVQIFKTLVAPQEAAADAALAQQWQQAKQRQRDIEILRNVVAKDWDGIVTYKVRPVADMSALTRAHRTVRSQALMAVKEQLPPIVQSKIMAEYLRSIDAYDIASAYEEALKQPQPPDPAMMAQVEAQKAAAAQMNAQAQKALSEAEKNKVMAVTMMADMEKLKAEIGQLIAATRVDNANAAATELQTGMEEHRGVRADAIQEKVDELAHKALDQIGKGTTPAMVAMSAPMGGGDMENKMENMKEGGVEE